MRELTDDDARDSVAMGEIWKKIGPSVYVGRWIERSDGRRIDLGWERTALQDIPFVKFEKRPGV